MYLKVEQQELDELFTFLLFFLLNESTLFSKDDQLVYTLIQQLLRVCQQNNKLVQDMLLQLQVSHFELNNILVNKVKECDLKQEQYYELEM